MSIPDKSNSILPGRGVNLERVDLFKMQIQVLIKFKKVIKETVNQMSGIVMESTRGQKRRVIKNKVVLADIKIVIQPTRINKHFNSNSSSN